MCFGLDLDFSDIDTLFSIYLKRTFSATETETTEISAMADLWYEDWMGLPPHHKKRKQFCHRDTPVIRRRALMNPAR